MRDLRRQRLGPHVGRLSRRHWQRTPAHFCPESLPSADCAGNPAVTPQSRVAPRPYGSCCSTVGLSENDAALGHEDQSVDALRPRCFRGTVDPYALSEAAMKMARRLSLRLPGYRPKADFAGLDGRPIRKFARWDTDALRLSLPADDATTSNSVDCRYLRGGYCATVHKTRTRNRARQCRRPTHMRTTSLVAAILAILTCPVIAEAQTPTNQDTLVVFVCEHGSVKSLVAALHFNRLAQNAGLNVRALSRGLDPDSVVPARIIQGLESDGLDVGAFTPTILGAADLEFAFLLVSFDQVLEDKPADVPIERWDALPSVTRDYERGRGAILQRVEELVRQLIQSRGK